MTTTRLVTTQKTTSLRGRHAHRLTTEERFWNRVQKTDSCWNWIGAGSESPRSYGRFQPELGKRICRQCAQAKSRAYRVRAGAAR